MIRGSERTAIFRDDRDRDSFINRFGDILLESSTPCYAWSQLSNHAHFLLRTGKIPIVLVMRRLLTGYAVDEPIGGEQYYRTSEAGIRA
jgi:putative transposase